MISFRFHLVSLVAVFLALGLGVLTGTTVLNRGIVAQLEQRTDDLAAESDELRQDVDQLRAESDMWSAFGEEVREPLLSGRLAQRQVILVTQVGTDDASIAGVQRALRDAGAELLALLSVSERMTLQSEVDRAELAGILGADAGAEPQVLREQAAGMLSERLATGPSGTDMLESLRQAEFLVNQGPGLGDEALRTLGGPDQTVVVVAGGPAPSPLAPAAFLIPLVDGLAAAGAPVAAAEPVDGQEQEPPFVTLLRSDGEVSSVIATQDNVDQPPGQIGLALAVQDLLEGVSGHYGVKDGASGGLIPDPA